MISIASPSDWYVFLDAVSGILKLTVCQSSGNERLCKSLIFVEVFLGRSPSGDSLKCGLLLGTAYLQGRPHWHFNCWTTSCLPAQAHDRDDSESIFYRRYYVFSLPSSLDCLPSLVSMWLPFSGRCSLFPLTTTGQPMAPLSCLNDEIKSCHLVNCCHLANFRSLLLVL